MRVTDKLQSAIDRARAHTMTDEERHAQRVSFVYGNTKLEYPNLRRDTAEAAVRATPRSPKR